jgi:hypothetical protein
MYIYVYIHIYIYIYLQYPPSVFRAQHELAGLGDVKIENEMNCYYDDDSAVDISLHIHICIYMYMLWANKLNRKDVCMLVMNGIMLL